MKGKVRFSKAFIDQEALSAKGFDYSADLGSDPRTLYPEDAKREGLASMLSVGMRYQGKTGRRAAAVHGKAPRIHAVADQFVESRRRPGRRGHRKCAPSRRRTRSRAIGKNKSRWRPRCSCEWFPQEPPKIPGIDLASVYVPCFELGGDLYDFFPLPYDNLGLAIADVSGKGVPGQPDHGQRPRRPASPGG